MKKKRIPWIFENRRSSKRKRTQGATFRIWLLGILLGVGVMGGGAGYLLFFSDVLRIEALRVLPEDNEITSSQLLLVKAVREKIDSFTSPGNSFIRENIVLLDEADLEREIRSSFPQISRVVVRKHYIYRMLEVSFRERVSVAIWCNVKLEFSESPGKESKTGEKPEDETQNDTTRPAVHDVCFYIDEEGILFGDAPLSKGSLITTIRDYGTYPDALLDVRPLSKEDLEFILEIKNALKKTSPPVGIREIIHERGEFTLVADEGWKLYLNREYSPAKHAAVLNEIFANPESKISEYIDLRITNKVYYK